MKITNVTVTTSEYGDFALGCECGGARYHIWLDRETRQARPANLSDPRADDGPVIFKNSLAKREEPGYFQTRKLSGDAVFGKALIAKMMAEAIAGDLFTKALDEVRREIEKELLENEIAATKKVIEPLAGQMLTALRAAQSALQPDNEAAAQVRAVLALADEAEAGVGDRYVEVWKHRLGTVKPGKA